MPDALTIPRIRRWMAIYAVTPRMLAEALGYDSSHIRRILKGQRPLMSENHPKVLAYFHTRKAECERDAALMHDLDRCA